MRRKAWKLPPSEPKPPRLAKFICRDTQVLYFEEANGERHSLILGSMQCMCWPEGLEIGKTVRLEWQTVGSYRGWYVAGVQENEHKNARK